MTTAPGEHKPKSQLRAFLLLGTAILFIALNLRIPTTALGPLLPQLRADTGAGETFLSLLTTIPLALTLVVAPFAPRLAKHLGLHKSIGWALVGIILGTVIRSMPGTATLMIGTVVLGAAIAIGTVLGPAAIAAQRPARRGPLTGIYTMALSLGPALALGLTIPLLHTTGFGWRGTLALWTAVGLIGLLLWISYSRTARPEQLPIMDSNVGLVSQSNTVPTAALTDLKVWALALYLGITSLTFYTFSAWLPTTFMMDGLSPERAGGYTSLINIVSLPFALLVPTGMRRGWGAVIAPCAPLPAVVGVALYLTAGSSAALPVALLLGLAQGCCLGVSYDQIVQYARSPDHAAAVSALTSTVGVAIASIGPLVYGFGLESTGSFIIPFGVLGGLIVLQAIMGLRTGRYGGQPQERARLG